MKLIATDIESKHHSLDREGFSLYLEKVVEVLDQQLKSVERLVEDFTKFGKLSEVKKETVRLDKFISSLNSTCQAACSENIYSFTAESPGNSASSIQLDLPLMMNVVDNIIRNALEANPDKKIEVGVSLLLGDEKCKIRIANNGSLIPKEYEDKIMSPYFSTKSGNTNKSNMGVGLSVSQKIVLDHGGTLFLAENNEHDGVVFEIELPFAKT